MMLRLYYYLTWHCHSIDGNISLTQEAAEYALNLSGGHIFSSPPECIAAAIPEVHVAEVIHNQHITYGGSIYSSTQTMWSF